MTLTHLWLAAFIVCVPALAGDAPANPWKEDIDKRLQRRVTFEFNDTPLTDTLGFLNQLSRVNIVLDPAADADKVSVSKRVSDSTLQDALALILNDSGLESEPLDEALFIFRKGAYRKPAETPLKPLTAEQTAELKKAVLELASNEFAVREAASKKIVAFGRDAQPLLKETLKESKDAEVRRRVQAVLASFQIRSFWTDPPEVIQALNVLEQKVTFEFVDTELANAVILMAKQLNAKITLDKAVSLNTVTLRVTDMTAASALRWIARLGKTKLTLQDGALRLVRLEEKAK